jgi:MFS transporter, MHS family, proline/betaine transporter
MNSAQHKITAAGVIGNVLEWYDFAIYGYFAAAIGRQFFPHEDPVAQLLSAFGVFALGYLMRPIGGALFGHIGDQFGRRAALTLSVAAMAIPTFLIGLLPGYATLGLWAPVALTLLRMTQGFSIGGEFTSSVVFLVERAPEGRRGLMGAVAMSGATGGILLGSAVGAAFAAPRLWHILEKTKRALTPIRALANISQCQASVMYDFSRLNIRQLARRV